MHLRFIILFILIFIISGCGTTHHFIPNRPLESGESMATITFNIDPWKKIPIDLNPNFNFYLGTENQANIGIGLKFPLYITHMTYARYWEYDNDYLSYFVHLNHISGGSANPILETGLSYYFNEKTIYQNLSLGVGYGNGLSMPLNPGIIDDSLWYSGYRFVPFAKYSIAGSDFGFSINYYHNNHKNRLINLLKIAESIPDTLLAINPNEIDTVLFPDSDFEYCWKTMCNIKLNNGDSILLGDYYRYDGHLFLLPIFIIDVSFRYRNQLNIWSNNQYCNSTDSLFLKTNCDTSRINTCIDYIRSKYEANEPIIFYSDYAGADHNLKIALDKYNFKNDISFGFMFEKKSLNEAIKKISD